MNDRKIMKINGSTKVCGLLAYPVEHSVSPTIHNYLAKKLQCNLAYVPLPVKDGDVEAAVVGAYAMGFLGMNVSVPYKEKVLFSLQEVDPIARKIGAVNTLVLDEGGYKGYNTDMPGLMRAFQSDGIRVCGRKVILLGAGGAARAAAFLCGEMGASHLYILNRTIKKAELIAEDLISVYPDMKVTTLLLEDYQQLEGADYLAIQCTNIGLFPHIDHAVIEDAAFYQKISTAYDLIFNPPETKFMKLAKCQGAETFHGLKMLLYQGIIAFELWNQVSVDEELAMKTYDKMKKALGIDE